MHGERLQHVRVEIRGAVRSPLAMKHPQLKATVLGITVQHTNIAALTATKLQSLFLRVTRTAKTMPKK